MRRCALLRDRDERLLGELEVDAVHIEDLLELAHERVARLGEDAPQRQLVERVERHDDRQSADELGNQSEAQQIFGHQLLEQLADAHVALSSGCARKPMLLAATRDSMIRSSPSKAPPQMKSTLVVSIWMNS